MPPCALLLDVAGPIEALRKANLEQDAVRFDVAYVGASPRVRTSVGLWLEGVAPLPARAPDGAWVIVPGAADQPLGDPAREPEVEARQTEELVAWIATAVRPGVKLISICSGALLAARAGVLDGHACTTHHALLDELARLAPTAKVLGDRLFVEDGERLTSAGITTGVDMMLHLIAREAGPRTALAVARFLVVYIRRSGGDPQLSPWLENRNHIHPAIHRAQDAVAADPTRAWSVAALARVAATSPRNLSRLFNEHAGCSVSEFVNRLRVALARELITGSRLDMESVAERAGFGSTRQLRRAWGRLQTSPPTALRSRGQNVAGPPDDFIP
jgi:transcriptional regulator GlxA family with amidase domain